MATLNTPPNISGSTQTPPPKSNRGLIIGMAAAIVALGGFGIYQFMDKNQVVEEKAVVETDKNKLEAEIQNLDKEIERMENELSTSSKENSEMKTQLKDLQDKIAGYKFQINKLISEGKLSKEEKERLKTKADELEFYNERYRNKVNELENQVRQLTIEKERITQEKDSTISTIEGEKRQIKEAGSKLIASDFEFWGINRREKETKGPELKARKINSLKVNFKLNRNEIAEVGQRELFMVIATPSGKVLKSMTNQSGYFTLNGREETYTAKKTVNFNRQELKLSMEYARPEAEELEKGKYTATLYVAGTGTGAEGSAYELGKDVFLLK